MTSSQRPLGTHLQLNKVIYCQLFIAVKKNTHTFHSPQKTVKKDYFGHVVQDFGEGLRKQGFALLVKYCQKVKAVLVEHYFLILFYLFAVQMLLFNSILFCISFMCIAQLNHHKLYKVFPQYFQYVVPYIITTILLTAVHVRESFFIFAYSFHSQSPVPPRAVSLLSMSLSLLCLLVQFVHQIPHMSKSYGICLSLTGVFHLA